MEYILLIASMPNLKSFYISDSYLPRVVELATTSVNRQTKVVACELLHALILFMIGKSTHDPLQQARKVSSIIKQLTFLLTF